MRGDSTAEDIVQDTGSLIFGTNKMGSRGPHQGVLLSRSVENAADRLFDRFMSQEAWDRQYGSWKATIDSLHSPNRLNQVPEFEFRFTDYTEEGGYRISPKTFDRFTKNGFGPEWSFMGVEQSTVKHYKHGDGELREIITQKGSTVQRKDYAGIVISEYGFSVSRSLETSYEKLPQNAIYQKDADRHRFRYSYILLHSPQETPLARIDLTEVRAPVKKGEYQGIQRIQSSTEKYQLSYHMEVELLPLSGGNSKKRWSDFCKGATHLLPALRQGRIVPIARHFAVLNDCNLQLGKIFPPPEGRKGKFNPWETKNQLESTFLTKPRNLHPSELRWGYIYGNLGDEYSYTVTAKADGERRLLYILQTGSGGEIWLLGFPTDSRLLLKASNFTRKEFTSDQEFAIFTRDLNSFFTDYNGAIIDGELVPPSKWRRSGVDLSSEMSLSHDEALEVGSSVTADRWTVPPTNENTSWFVCFDLIAKSNLTSVVKLSLKQRTVTHLREISDRFKSLFFRIGVRPLIMTLKSYLYLSPPTPFKAIGGDLLAKELRPQTRRPLSEEERIEIEVAKKYGYYTLYTEEYPEEFFFSRIRLSLRLLSNLPYQTDGLIFTPQGRYNPLTALLPDRERRIGLGGVMDVMKWKETTDLTVDLAFSLLDGRVQLEASLGAGYTPFTSGILGPEEIKKLATVPARSVVEFEVISEEKGIQQLKFRGRRYDKQMPNSIKVVESNLRLFRDPITASTISGRNMKLAFLENNRVKSDLIAEYIPRIPKEGRGPVVLDIGIGKGGDLKKMEGASRIYGVEPNPTNRDQLRSRIEGLAKKDPAWREKVIILEQGGEDPISSNIIPDRSVDVVSLMFCLTFFWEPSGNPILLEGLLRNVNRVLKVGGHVIFATLDGNAIDEFFSENAIGGYYLPPLGTLSRPVVPGKGAEGMILDLNGKDTEIANDKKFFTKFQNVVDGVVVAEIQPLENGQIWTSIPESATITGQVESLVYIRDILRLAPNFSTVKTGRIDQEKLLTEAQRSFSRFYMYGSLAKGAEDVYTSGSISLTDPQVYGEMARRASLQPLAPPPINPPPPVLSPLQVTPPQALGQPANGDDVRQFLSTNYLTSLQYIGAERELPEAQWKETERLDFPHTNVVRIACIPGNPIPAPQAPAQKDNFFHALLKGSSSRYWREASYEGRVKEVEKAKQIIRKFIADPNNYFQDINQKMVVITTDPVQIRNPDGSVVTKVNTIVPFGAVYSPQLLLGFYDQYLRGMDPLDDFIMPLISLCFRVHIAVYSAAGPKARLSYMTAMDLPIHAGYNYLHTIILLRFPGAGNSYHYEMVASHNMSNNMTHPFWNTSDEKIMSLNNDIVDDRNYQLYRRLEKLRLGSTL